MTTMSPNYLKDYKDLYNENPREANMKWFIDSKYGLFIHYGLYSILNRHEWVQLYEKIPVNEYSKLIDDFTAENFDAEIIAKFAKDNNLKYITFTTRHHESFCLWDTEYTTFNSLNSPAKRDLVAELATACEKYELGLFLYYSHGRDWKHPHAPNNDKWGGSARPDYSPEEPSYKYGDNNNLDIYLEFMKNQITELLVKFPNIAGIWLDGIAVPLSGDPTLFKCDELYTHIHNLSPHALVSYKQGVTGTEDFYAPEHNIPNKTNNSFERGKIGKISKHIEICTTTLDKSSWGCNKYAGHKPLEEMLKKVNEAKSSNSNLLLNIGLLPDGSIHPNETQLLNKLSKFLLG